MTGAASFERPLAPSGGRSTPAACTLHLHLRQRQHCRVLRDRFELLFSFSVAFPSLDIANETSQSNKPNLSVPWDHELSSIKRRYFATNFHPSFRHGVEQARCC